MKREIVCLPCGQRLRRILMPSDPGEYHKLEAGKALHSCVCDSCNEKIPRGTECEALSMWTDRIPYYEWEHEYLVREVRP